MKAEKKQKLQLIPVRNVDDSHLLYKNYSLITLNCLLLVRIPLMHLNFSLQLVLLSSVQIPVP